uniref:Uncharacterized protein n=1 Tax=Poecilia reticulata TaxID=8081 RepID=A0A3P9PZM0_POERE
MLFSYHSGDDAQMELKQLTLAVFVIREEGEGLKESPEDIGIVIEGVEVLHDLTSVASACALLLGLIYALNLAYPKPLRFTFEVFQKIFMQLDQHKMSPKFSICLEDFRPHSEDNCILCKRTYYFLSLCLNMRGPCFGSLTSRD